MLLSLTLILINNCHFTWLKIVGNAISSCSEREVKYKASVRAESSLKLILKSKFKF